jgi:hypothetical protein
MIYIFMYATMQNFIMIYYCLSALVYTTYYNAILLEAACSFHRDTLTLWTADTGFAVSWPWRIDDDA